MATLKQHQAAMVELLAHGSALSASGARMAHAIHDLLAAVTEQPPAPEAHTERRSDSTTPGINDAMLALDIQAVKPKATTAEQRVKHLENTVNQLRDVNKTLGAQVANLIEGRDELKHIVDLYDPPQAGCRKEDTQCKHRFNFASPLICIDCGADRPHSKVEPGDDSWDTDRRPGGDGGGGW